MVIHSAQKYCKELWQNIEPLVVPAIAGVGLTFLVGQVYGRIAACCFGAALFGIGMEYRDLIVIVTKNEFFMGIARLVAMAILPFFGTWGIIASMGIATISSFSLDVRLYTIREKQKEAERLLREIEQLRQKLNIELEAMTKEREAHNKSHEEFWKTVKPVEAVTEAIDRYEAMIRDNQVFLVKKLDGADMSAAETVLAQIEQFTQFIEQQIVQTAELKALVADTTLKLHEVKGVSP